MAKLAAITHTPRTWCRPMQALPIPASSVSVTPYEPCLVNSVGHVLLVSSIQSDSYSPYTLSSAGFPKL